MAMRRFRKQGSQRDISQDIQRPHGLNRTRTENLWSCDHSGYRELISRDELVAQGYRVLAC